MLSKAKELVSLSHSEVCLMLEDLSIQQSVDLGATLVQTGYHAGVGLMLLVSEVSGGGAYCLL